MEPIVTRRAQDPLAANTSTTYYIFVLSHQIKKKKPNEKEFSLPTTQDELDEMMINMKKSGFDKDAVIKIFKERKARYDQAVDEYEKAVTESLSTSQCQ